MAQRTNQQIIDALRDAQGMVAVAARSLGVSRQTVYNRMEKSAEVREAFEEAREFTTDRAETKLFEAIEKGEGWAVCFYLKCQAKDRGYIEKQQHEHSGKDGEPIEVRTVRVPEKAQDANEWAERHRGVAVNGGPSGNGSAP